MLTEKEMLNVYGGKVSWSLITTIGGVITLLVGIIDGFFRPLKCN